MLATACQGIKRKFPLLQLIDDVGNIAMVCRIMASTAIPSTRCAVPA